MPERFSPKLRVNSAGWEGGRVKLSKPEHFIFTSKNSHSPPKPTLKAGVYLSLSALLLSLLLKNPTALRLKKCQREIEK